MKNYDFLVQLIKISLIFNMIQDGWHFRYLGNNILEFKKKRLDNEDINLNRLLRKHLC